MITHPKLLSCYVPVVADATTVLLLHETAPRVLRGRLYALIVPLLDGRRSVEEIIGALEDRASAAEVLYIIGLLEGRGHLVEHDPIAPPDLAAFWHSLGVDTRTLGRRLEETPIALTAIGCASAEPLATALAPLGVRIQERGSLSVIVTDDYLEPELDAVNRRAVAEKRPFLLVKLIGVTAWIGPIFHPDRTGCWACLSQRLIGNRPLDPVVARLGAAPVAIRSAALPAVITAAANLAALEIVKWIAGAGSRLDGRLVTLDAANLQLKDHILVRRPQCPVCGNARADAPEAIALERRRKAFTADGGHRIASPEEAIAAYAHHISPITGAVRQLERTPTEAGSGIYTYDSGPNLAKKSDDLATLRSSFRMRSQGKGKTDAQARASALCEALERYSGVFQGDEPRRRARAEDLGGAAILPNACMHFSAAQYEARRAWNASIHDAEQKVPAPFDPSIETEWSPLWSLTHGDVKYLPTAYCYYAYPIAPEDRFCIGDSNGCAAGASREEAILQGFMELVERDGVSLWWYNRLKRPRLDLTSFDEPYFEQIAAAYRSIGRELWVLDLTTDLRIPTFAALSRKIDRPEEEITLGFGAHFDARIAALRAVTEGNQFLPFLERLSSAPAEGAAGHDTIRSWLRTATLANQPYLDFDRAAPAKRAADYPDASTDDLAEDVRRCVAAASALGMETLVLDQTRPDIGLPVVKVVVPGMRHFWKRLGPGRLYDVPVKLGWLDAPLAEDRLNPLFMFL